MVLFILENVIVGVVGVEVGLDEFLVNVIIFFFCYGIYRGRVSVEVVLVLFF